MLCCKKKGNGKSKKCCAFGKCCNTKNKKKSSLKAELVKKLLYAGAFALLLFVIEKVAEKLNAEE